MQQLNRNPNPAPRGGQASLSLFGVGGLTSKHAPHLARPNPRPARPTVRKAWTSRIKGVLNPGDRDGLTSARDAAPPMAQAAPVAAPVAKVAPEAKLAFPPPRRAYDPDFNEAQYQDWLDELLADARAAQEQECALLDAIADVHTYGGNPRPATPAMRRAARESAQQDAREWREAAEAADSPEWNQPALALD